MSRIPVVVLVILLSLGSTFACGDKLVMLGRGISFGQIHKTNHPASILIYMNAGSELPAVDKHVQLQTVLKLAGHKLKSIENRTEFLQALSSGNYDFVITGLSDAGIVKNEIGSAPAKPMPLTLLHKPSNQQLADSQKQFSCAFKAERNNQILRVLDEAMKSKQKGTTPRCPTR